MNEFFYYQEKFSLKICELINSIITSYKRYGMFLKRTYIIHLCQAEKIFFILMTLFHDRKNLSNHF